MATLFPPTHGPHNFLKPFFNPPCSFSKSLSSWAPLRLGTVPLSLIHFSLRLRLLLSKAEMWRKRGMEGISKEGRKTERKSWPKLRHRTREGERLCERTNRRRERERITRRWLHATFGIIQEKGGSSLPPSLTKFLGQWMRQWNANILTLR